MQSLILYLLFFTAIVAGSKEICDGVPPYVLQPDEKSCEKFFICIEGNPVYGVCPDSYRFNKATSECAKQETVSCDIVEEAEAKPKGEGPATRVEDKVEQLEKEVIDMEVTLAQVKEKIQEVKAEVNHGRDDIVEGPEEIVVIE